MLNQQRSLHSSESEKGKLNIYIRYSRSEVHRHAPHRTGEGLQYKVLTSYPGPAWHKRQDIPYQPAGHPWTCQLQRWSEFSINLNAQIDPEEVQFLRLVDGWIPGNREVGVLGCLKPCCGSFDPCSSITFSGVSRNARVWWYSVVCRCSWGRYAEHWEAAETCLTREDARHCGHQQNR